MFDMSKKLIPIGQASALLGVSIDTLRRWDKSGKLKSIRLKNEKSHRYYDVNELALFGIDLLQDARDWAITGVPYEPEHKFYCPDTSIFQARLNRFEGELSQISGLEAEFSLITSIVGEIGNNSFDHNLGAWPDIRGIFFGYSLDQRQVVLADRGQGILTTLKRVRPALMTDQEALAMAFTEKVSGRSPESRGNGLKFVRRVITQDTKTLTTRLFFQTGSAELILNKDELDLAITASLNPFRGCLAFITY